MLEYSKMTATDYVVWADGEVGTYNSASTVLASNAYNRDRPGVPVVAHFAADHVRTLERAKVRALTAAAADRAREETRAQLAETERFLREMATRPNKR